jgi:putative ABC transport system substrate-binding protein
MSRGPSTRDLDLLKEMAPGVTRVAVLRDPGTASGIGQFAAIQSVAPELRVELNPVNVRDADVIKRDITAFARALGNGLIVTGSPSAAAHRELIAARGQPSSGRHRGCRNPT